MASGPTANLKYLPTGELDNTANISPSQIIQRSFNPDTDTLRVDVIEGNITLNPGNINIGSITIKDQNSGLNADVEDCGDGFNGLVVKPCLVVRDDVLSTLTVSDGSFTQLRVDSQGALWVKHSGEVSINDGGNSITVDGVDFDIRDLIHTTDSIALGDGISTLVGVDDRSTTAKGLDTLPLAEFSSTFTTLTNGQVSPLQLTSDGRLKVDSNINQITDIDDNSVSPNQTVPIDLTLGYAYNETSAIWKRLKMDDDDRLIVTSLSIPAGAIQTNIFFQKEVSKSGASEIKDTIITSGKTYTIQKFIGGGFTKESKVEIYFGTPAVNEVGMTFIQAIYVNKSHEETTVNDSFLGDGTNVLRIKLINNTDKKKEMYGSIVGFEF